MAHITVEPLYKGQVGEVEPLYKGQVGEVEPLYKGQVGEVEPLQEFIQDFPLEGGGGGRQEAWQ